MQEVEEDLVRRARGRLIVDDIEACSSEAGDLIKAGVDSRKCISLGELLNHPSFKGLADGSTKELPSFKDQDSILATMNDRLGQREEMGDVTIFKSVGIGLQDVAVTSLVVQKAIEQDKGTFVDF
jgi:ornithine cyclodeaminase/alanine dehydrogenase-like protein (mu-crystallin family)